MPHRTLLTAALLAAWTLHPARAATPPLYSAGKPLKQLLGELAAPSGVRFHVAPTVAQDRVRTRAEGTAWPEVIQSLLRGYNYTATWSAGRLLEVRVTGRNGDGTAPPADLDPAGELVSYRAPVPVPARYRSYRPGSVYPIQVPTRRLRTMKIGERIAVSLPDGRYWLLHDHAWRHDNGDLTWVGYLEGPQGRFRTVLTLGDGAVEGQIRTPGGLYKVESGAAGLWLIDINAAGLKRTPLEGDQGAAAARAVDHGDRSRPVSATTTPDGKAVIDVLLLYTPAMAKPGVRTRLNQLLALANQALVDSQVKAVFRLAGARPIGYRNGGDNSQVLDDLSHFTGGLGKVPQLRAQTGADVVVLVRRFWPASQGGNCGIAWVNGSGATELRADLAFAVIGYGAAGGYYCSDYTLAHELGHVLGATHDRQHANVAGKFPYSYGYGIENRFGDIMSYFDPEVGVYSNPAIALCAGSPCGIPPGQPQAADVAATFNQTAPTVSAFVGAVPR